MKTRLIVPTWGLFCLSFQVSTAQIAPMFEMPIYFEDAIGNKDTVIVGYDPDAIANGLNLQFGETWLDTPFDSIFEVRVSHSEEWPYRTGKKIIEHYDDSPPSDCGPSSNVEIILHAKHFPIKISYDTAFINASACHKNMILSPDWQIFL